MLRQTGKEKRDNRKNEIRERGSESESCSTTASSPFHLPTSFGRGEEKQTWKEKGTRHNNELPERHPSFLLSMRMFIRERGSYCGRKQHGRGQWSSWLLPRYGNWLKEKRCPISVAGIIESHVQGPLSSWGREAPVPAEEEQDNIRGGSDARVNCRADWSSVTTTTSWERRAKRKELGI